MAKAKGEAGENLLLRGGVYYARIQVNGVDRRISLRTRDRAEAKRKLKAELELAERERAGELSEVTFQKAVISWSEAGYGVRGDKTRDRYMVSLRQLTPHFLNLRMHEITRRKIGEYVGVRIKAGASHATVRRDLTALSGLLRHCVAKDWRDDNPARDWDRSTIREYRDPFERVDMRSFEACVAEASKFWATYLKFLLASGFRTEVDAAALRRDKVNWQTGAVTFTTKRGRLRTRQLSAEALALLKEVPASLHSAFVFAPPGKEKMTGVAQQFEHVRARAEKRAQREGWVFKPFHLHSLRHEFAIGFLKHGGPGGGVGSIYTLQGMLGHTSVLTTEIYLDYLTDEEAEIAKRQREPSPVAKIGGERDQN